MDDGKRKPARTARTGGASDLMAGDPDETNRDLERTEPHPQGAGGLDVAEDAEGRVKKRTKRRLTRVLR
jgi:hypothetical protein